LEALDSLVNKRTRVAISSGNLQPVLDSLPGQDNSVFALAFINALKEVEDIGLTTDIYEKVSSAVYRSLSGTGVAQNPQFSSLQQARHESGDFLFFRQ
jgi:hypothetical protein